MNYTANRALKSTYGDGLYRACMLYYLYDVFRSGCIRMRFVREKKIFCGPSYVEVDIIPRTWEADMVAKRGTRSKKKRESAPKQRNLNEKNAKRYLRQLGNGNFVNGDWFISLSYQEKFKPESMDQAEKEVGNYIRRLKTRYKKLGHELKYILVNEGGTNTVRFNHHLIINSLESGLDRDDVEALWSKKPKGQKRERIGMVNARSIQTNENGLEGILTYLSKDPKGRKRWSSSRNLVRPVSRPNDHKYGPRTIEKIAQTPDQGRDYFEKKYPEFDISEIEAKYYEETGWHVYLKMWRRVGRINR